VKIVEQREIVDVVVDVEEDMARGRRVRGRRRRERAVGSIVGGCVLRMIRKEELRCLCEERCTIPCRRRRSRIVDRRIQQTEVGLRKTAAKDSLAENNENKSGERGVALMWLNYVVFVSYGTRSLSALSGYSIWGISN